MIPNRLNYFFKMKKRKVAKFISRVSVVFKGNWDWSKYSLEYVEQEEDDVDDV